MTGWLIYDADGAKRNVWFIDELTRRMMEYDIRLELKVVCREDSLILSESDASVWPDFVVVRTINPKINRYFEGLGIRCFNNYATSETANSKWNTYKLGLRLGMPVMKTVLAGDVNTDEDLAFPLIAKSLDGHGGTEVYKVDDIAEYHRICELHGKERMLLQKMCDTPGIDMRVYVLGNDIVAGVKRESTNSFKSNYSLGGSAVLSAVTAEQKDMVDRLVGELKPDLVGIDFIRHRGQWILNEIEDVVGTRMLYSSSDIDIVKEYVGYIVCRMTEHGKAEGV